MSKSKAFLLLVLANLFWAGNYVFGKYVIAQMTPLWMTFSRWLLALIVLLPIACLIEKPDWKQVGRAWLPLLGMALLGVIGYNILLYSSLFYTSSTNAALVNSLNPALIVLFSVLLLREKIKAVQVGGFVLSLFGVIVILTQGHVLQIFHTEFNKGDLLMLAAILVWTFYSILGRRLSSIPPVTATAVSAVFAVILMLPVALYQGIDLAKIGPLAVIGMLYIVLFPSIGSFVFWNMAVREVGPSRSGIFLNLIAVFTALISVILGEKLTAPQSIGGLLVIAGVCLTSGITDRKKSLPIDEQLQGKQSGV
ncbi:DMT family transporter [Effusibacillus dendaii]|uniref:DMT family transporter n=1 Tax=Effusibacillus dendaii TaxID=2743772 RepID=UPI0019091610|nr:DMT family transporter [Effusibacillus dendaii]